MIKSIETNKVLWVIGALERLSYLGMLSEPPVRVSPDAIDDFIELDEVRDCLFVDENEIPEIVKELVYEFNGKFNPNLVKELSNLVISYKNDRDRMVKYAFNCIYNLG